MDTTTIIQLIGSVGFPIVACVYLATYFKSSMDKLTQAVNTLILSLQGQESQVLAQVRAIVTPSQNPTNVQTNS